MEDKTIDDKAVAPTKPLRNAIELNDLLPVVGYFRYCLRTPPNRTDELQYLPSVIALAAFNASFIMPTLLYFARQ